MTIESIARTDVVTAEPDAPVGRVAKTLRDERVGSVVVVEGDRPGGILTDRDVTMDDLTRLFVTELANLAAVVADESPPH